jgi:hypothetical protein
MIGETAFSASGRTASMERRRALSLGKAGLPPAAERVRSGFRAAALPGGEGPGAAAPAVPVLERPVDPQPSSAGLPAAGAAALASNGREAAMTRRRLMVLDKGALTAAKNSSAATAAPREAAPAAGPCAPAAASGRELAMARRAQLSRYGRGTDCSAGPSRPPRQGELTNPPKVVETRTAGSVRVTGYSAGTGRQMTGAEAGRDLPVSGTQYIGPGEGGFRAAAAKVGLARTEGGLVVSGTMVRSKARITGDEAGTATRITGEADQTPDDDLSPRRDDVVPVSAQFGRQASPHGQSVFGTNLGRSARSVGSRDRDRTRPLEVTASGLPVSGTAIGRSVLVTGDEPGACALLTGSQYLAPARAVTACGGPGRGSGPMAGGAAARRDPVTGAKVAEAQTWGGQRVTGTDFEHAPNVTGTEPGTCSAITGTPYLGATSGHGWCDQAAAARQESVLPARSVRHVTGDVPLGDPKRVSGTARGSERSVSGTPYWQSAPAPEAQADGDPLAVAAAAFSVMSPQRQAQLARRSDAPRGPRISGSFAVGDSKLTGSVEFAFRDRSSRAAPTPAPADAAERPRLTGEAGTKGAVVTGDAWSENPRVTGTEGFFSAGRNPSERRGERQGFAGAMQFKGKIQHEPPRRLVTGVIGGSPKSAAIITLSGGAQG